jgi:dihydrofolate reductase
MNVIVAHDDHFGIGKNNTIPWHSTEDLDFFKKKTMNCVLIMGRKTFESLSLASKKNLNSHGRMCIVVTTKEPNYTTECILAKCYNSAKQLALQHRTKEYIFFIGGSTIYEKAFEDRDVTNLFITHIKGNYDCDVKIHFIKNEKWQINTKNLLGETGHTVTHYNRIQSNISTI